MMTMLKDAWAEKSGNNCHTIAILALILLLTIKIAMKPTQLILIGVAKG
jgi:hypothetical protein